MEDTQALVNIISKEKIKAESLAHYDNLIAAANSFPPGDTINPDTLRARAGKVRQYIERYG